MQKQPSPFRGNVQETPVVYLIGRAVRFLHMLQERIRVPVYAVQGFICDSPLLRGRCGDS